MFSSKYTPAKRKKIFFPRRYGPGTLYEKTYMQRVITVYKHFLKPFPVVFTIVRRQFILQETFARLLPDRKACPTVFL